MSSEDDLKDELHRRWHELFERIKAANQDFSQRISLEQLVFELDADDDSLVITIGPRPDFAYTQGMNHTHLDMDESDRIVAITIDNFSKCMNERDYSALHDLANALRHVGRIEVPATGDRSKEVERELRELVPA